MFTEVITAQVHAGQAKKDLEVKLKQSQRLEDIGTLPGVNTYNFNNIFNPILIQSDMSLLKLPQDRKALPYLEKKHKAADRDKTPVQEILVFSIPDEQDNKLFQVSPIVTEALKLISASLLTTVDIQSGIHTPDDLDIGDPIQIHQMIVHLRANAGDARQKKNGLLKAILSIVKPFRIGDSKHQGLKPGPFLELKISDTVDGMDSPIDERIFDPYDTTKNKVKGTRLGLAIVYGIVQHHAGAVIVSSESNQGTSFAELLPHVNTQQIMPSDESEDTYQWESESILLVDDEVPTVETQGEMPEATVHRVVGKTDSLEAYHLIKRGPISLILSEPTK